MKFDLTNIALTAIICIFICTVYVYLFTIFLLHYKRFFIQTVSVVSANKCFVDWITICINLISYLQSFYAPRRRFENEVVSMTASMMNGDDDVVGSLTSGGTESILMAMKAYRDRARKLFPHIQYPEMVK